MRAALLAATLVAAGCQFDTTGAGGAADDSPAAPDATAAAPDAPAPGDIDAAAPDAPAIPADAGEPDAPSELLTCGGADDCPGQTCCVYGLGIGSACVDACVGGEVTCEVASDCTDPLAGECCPLGAGVNVCRIFCL